MKLDYAFGRGGGGIGSGSGEDRRALLQQDNEDGEGAGTGDYRTTACDVYSFGVILAELWNAEVPFQTALENYAHEYQLAEAICRKAVRLNISTNMPSKVSQAR